MGSYVFGFIVSIFMILMGISGKFFGSGISNSDLFLIVGVIFLAINIAIVIRAKKNGRL